MTLAATVALRLEPGARSSLATAVGGGAFGVVAAAAALALDLDVDLFLLRLFLPHPSGFGLLRLLRSADSPVGLSLESVRDACGVVDAACPPPSVDS